jgi:MoaA/NifB/PqqE/SkfB family radical SAM enzyme
MPAPAPVESQQISAHTISKFLARFLFFIFGVGRSSGQIEPMDYPAEAVDTQYKKGRFMLTKEMELTRAETRALKTRSAAMSVLFSSFPYIPNKLIHYWTRNLLEVARLPMGKRFFEQAMMTLKQMLKQVNPTVRKKIVKNFFINECIRGDTIRTKIARNIGFELPALIVISPTMRCPLRCTGCYSAQYAQNADLEFPVFDQLITEAKSMGIYFFVISGGEPFAYPHIYDLFKKHNDAWFQVYTSGVFLNKENTRRIAELGNVNPCISVEGFEAETDRRRGKGHYKKVLTAFQNMRDAGVPFGFSATATRENNNLIMSDEFVDFYSKQGALVGWYFQYMPIGRQPNLDLVPTPQQRMHRFYRMIQLREKFNIFLVDFWNDGWLTGGCIAGSRRYLHINHKGDIEPCVFCQIAVENIHKKGLLDALGTSPLFRSIRKRQPYNHNLLRPCMIIDNPEVLKNVVNEVSASETCNESAKTLVGDCFPDLRKYADEYGKMADEAWETFFGRSYPKTKEAILKEAEKGLAKYS